MSRTLVPLLIAAALAGAGAIAWLALRDDGEEPTDGLEPGVDAPVAEDELVASEMDAGQRRKKMHDGWPFGEFNDDILVLRTPEHRKDEPPDEVLEGRNWKKASKKKLTLRLENTSVQEVVKSCAEQLAEAGVKVVTFPPYLPEDFPLGDFVMQDQPIEYVIELLIHRSGGLITYRMNSEGLVIGTPDAIFQGNKLAEEAGAERNNRNAARDALLAKEFLPNFQKAGIDAIVKDVRAQCEVDLVVDAETWEEPKLLTWRSRPMPLGDALQRIAREFKAQLRVRNGRAFLIRL